MLNNKKILIVEDELSLRQILIQKFKQEGFDVFEARDGIEGLEAVAKNKPDLILLDLVMPRMDGITFLRKLKKEQAGENIPIIILTNLGDSNNVAEALNEGSFNYLIKTDWTLEEIVQKVKRTIVNN